MRSAKWLLVFTLVAGACASPLDAPIGSSEADLYGLPGCDATLVGGGADATVVPAGEAGLYAVAVDDVPVCLEDDLGLAALGIRAVTGAKAYQGTPLPPTPAPDDARGTRVARGTPLPASK